jgi:hypothetical protein
MDERQLVKKSENMFCTKFVNQNGKWVEIKSEKLNVWAAVNIETGEVDMDEIFNNNDGLPEILPSWEWREFLLVPALAPGKP